MTIYKARDYVGSPNKPADAKLRSHNSHTKGVKASSLPRSSKKYRPDAGAARFAKASTCSSVTRLIDDSVEGPNVRDVTEMRRTNNGLQRVKTEKYWTPKRPLPKGL